jgi:hypothetical protein
MNNKVSALHDLQRTIKPNGLALAGDIVKLLAKVPRERLEAEIRRIAIIFDLIQRHTDLRFFDDIRTAQRFSFVELVRELVGIELQTEKESG